MEPSEWTGGRRILAPRGKTLGGSSSINGHIYNRGQRMDFDTWAQMGNRGWGYADVLPYFRRMERRLGDGDPTYRGRDGSLTVSDLDWRHPLCEAFIEGAVSLGIPRNPDYNGAVQEGVAYAQRTINNGRRVSAATAFLHPARKRPNLTVRTHAHTDRAGTSRASAASASPTAVGGRGGETQQRPRGARGDPLRRRLQLAAAPAALRHRPGARCCKSLGIPVRHALAGVGENLRDHYAPRFTARVKNIDTINERARGLKLVARGDPLRDDAQGHPGAQPHARSTASGAPSPSIANSDLQFTFTPASYREGVQGQLDLEPGMTIASWQQRPDSRGYVRLRSADPFDAPIIQPNYLAEEGDRRVLLAAMKLARRLLKTEAARALLRLRGLPGRQGAERRRAARAPPRSAAPPRSIPPAPAAWRPRPIRWPWSTISCACTASRACASSTPRSCRPCSRPTSTPATLMLADKASDLIRGRAAPEPIVLAS